MGNFLMTERDKEIAELEKLFGVTPYGFDNTGGYATAGEILYTTNDGVDPNTLWDEAQQALVLWNQHRDKLVSLFTFDVVDEIEEVPQVGEATMEEASEFGEPEADDINLGYFNLGYDFTDYDRATRFTWKYIRDANANAVRARANALLAADTKNVFKQVMSAIFDNRGRQTSIRGNAIPVYPLYNNDGTVPPPYRGTTFSSSHNHYLVSGNTAIDSGDVEIAIDHIEEHGYSIQNGTQLVLFANRDILRAMRGWRQGQVSANGVVANYDFIPSANQPAQILSTSLGLLGEQPPATWNGLKTYGSYGDVILIEESFIPADYFLMVGTGGAGNLKNLVGFRQHKNAQYRGLKLFPGNDQRYPLVESFYTHGFGTGIRQRAGGVVMQIKASGSYEIPEAYDRRNGLFAA